jgi:mannose-1-phosphate guanylyltransferase/mannose-6-phosphate isomerase
MRHLILPAIMSGGSGTRLWPVSTAATPKQFHALNGAASLIAETALRTSGEHGALSFTAPLVLCNSAHVGLVEAHLAAVGCAPRATVAEPFGRNTAAAAAIAAQLAQEFEPDALVLLLPADHVIKDETAFRAAIERAAPIARARIVTFGIEPSRAELGYGYIKRGEELAPGVFAVERFTEKPDAAAAQAYLDGRQHSWNAGIFFFNPRMLLEEFAAAPDIRDDALAALAAGVRAGAVISLDAALFEKVRAAPFDKAVMEKTARAAVAPCDIGWADIGAWDEIWRLGAHDAAGNHVAGPVVVLDGANNLVRSDGPKVCVAGVSDLIVIATADAVIVLPRARAQDVKTLRELADKLD